jgi:hypothetical protein
MSATNEGVANNGYQAQIANIDISRLTRDERAALLGRLLASLLTPDESPARESNASECDRLLDATETADRLNVKRGWLYHNARKLDLAVELGKGTLRFSPARIQQFIREGGVQAHKRKRSLKR